jgi:hypothetical protein
LAVAAVLLLLGSNAQAQGAAKACASGIKTLCGKTRHRLPVFFSALPFITVIVIAGANMLR